MFSVVSNYGMYCSDKQLLVQKSFMGQLLNLKWKLQCVPKTLIDFHLQLIDIEKRSVCEKREGEDEEPKPLSAFHDNHVLICSLDRVYSIYLVNLGQLSLCCIVCWKCYGADICQELFSACL